MKKIILGTLAAVSVFTACGSAQPAERATTSAAADGTAVAIEHIAFDPARVEIAAGETVTWTNLDTDVTHTVTSGRPGDKGIPGVNEGRPDEPDGLFDANLDGDGSSFEFVFEDAGTYPYFCRVHPVMTGTIVVE